MNVLRVAMRFTQQCPITGAFIARKEGGAILSSKENTEAVPMIAPPLIVTIDIFVIYRYTETMQLNAHHIGHIKGARVYLAACEDVELGTVHEKDGACACYWQGKFVADANDLTRALYALYLLHARGLPRA